MLSSKAKSFMDELEALCKKHKIQIAVDGYDPIQIWDLEESEHCIYIDSNGIEDKTIRRTL